MHTKNSLLLPRATLTLVLYCCTTLLLAACGGGSGSNRRDTTAPSVPQNVTATATSAGRIEVQWNAATDAGGSGLVGYRIFRDGSTTELGSSSAPATSFADTAVVPNTQYSYTVAALDGAGNLSARSSAATATTPNGPTTSGLDARPSNATCLAWPRPSAGSLITLTRFTNLTFTNPLLMLQAPADASRWFVVEQAGIVKQFNTATPTSSSNFIDIVSRVSSGGELGLLGMAFHPDFPTDPRVFLSYTTGAAGQRRSIISAFRTTNGGATLDPSTEQILLTLNQPEDNHNGGNVVFGPDGFLYIGFGDGGGGGDNHGDPGNGQRRTTLLGKMLRIDVDGAAPYEVPSSNPFFAPANPSDRCSATARATGTCPEIFALGFRNPFRWSFDRLTGALWVADVGQNLLEEVDLVTSGGNYGWRCREGAQDFNSAGTTGCSSGGLIDPVAEYGRDLGVSITGGHVYRGTQPTALAGRFLFADFGSGRIFALLPEAATAPRQPTTLIDTDLNISSFGEGNDGELYVVDFSGTLHRIVFQATQASNMVPASLSATGCVSPSNAQQVAGGVIPYDINAPFYSDNAVKRRWLALPDDQKVTVQANGDFDFPSGTVLMKDFRVGEKLIETRLLMRHPDGNWGGFSYAWNAQQTDAALVQGGDARDIGNGQQWIFPSESQCLECHTAAANRALGPETAQLNRNFLYPQTGRTANQLTTLSIVGVLSSAVDAGTAASLPDPANAQAPLASRARAYLHTNCAQCHRPSGPTPSNMDLRFTTALSATNACNAAPQSGDLGLGAAARLIAPGNANLSLIVNRANRRDGSRMPPLGSNIVDAAGVNLLTQWIAGLGACTP
jgi:uncharacterized repeat protein (TIGR03806 family)